MLSGIVLTVSSRLGILPPPPKINILVFKAELAARFVDPNNKASEKGLGLLKVEATGRRFCCLSR